MYRKLAAAGHADLAGRLEKRLDLRSHPDSNDVAKLLSRWEREADGPETAYDWLAVSRLWQRADQVPAALEALDRVERASGDRVERAELLLDRARVAFLSGDAQRGADAYWQGCAGASDAAALGYWLDFLPLATPAEVAAWGAFRTLPASQRDLCRFLERMWNRRSAASGLSLAERMQLHHARTRFARKHYLRRGKKEPGFTTRLGRPENAIFDDRGLLYIRMGDPDETSIYLGNSCFEPNITWAYEYPNGNRLYHLTTGGGTDNWWLIRNLGGVYRCGAADRDPFTTAPTALGLLPAGLVAELYQSRAGLDVRYQQIAYRGSGVVLVQELAREREWTLADGEFAVADVPDRPPVNRKSRLRGELLQFRTAPSENTKVWMNAVVEGKELNPKELPNGSVLYELLAMWSVLTEDGELRRYSSEIDIPADERLGEDESIPVRIRADLPSGRHLSTLVVRERESSGSVAVGAYSADTVQIRRFSGSVPLLSDVVVAPDSGGSWTPGGGVYLRPSPVHSTGPDGVAYVYFEAYNLSQGAEYTTRVRMEPLNGGEPFELEYPGESAARGRVVTRGHLRVDLSQTQSGNYRMSVSVRDAQSGLTTLPSRTEIVVDRTDSAPGS